MPLLIRVQLALRRWLDDNGHLKEDVIVLLVLGALIVGLIWKVFI